MSETFGPAEFQQKTNVSRETLERLRIYAGLVEKWQPSINLIGSKTLPDLWWRHLYDSAQLAPHVRGSHIPNPACLDMGTGAGFPGVVLAIMGVGRWALVESDARKCVFLQEVIRQTGISVTLYTRRIEEVEGLKADIVTARALAPLSRLLGYAQGFMGPASVGIFPKGRRYREEVAAAQKAWSFNITYRDSVTDQDGKILILQRVNVI